MLENQLALIKTLGGYKYACRTFPLPVMIEEGCRGGVIFHHDNWKRSVIDARSVVTKDIPANSLAVESPCRVDTENQPNLRL